jgi:hypothetical protein
MRTGIWAIGAGFAWCLFAHDAAVAADAYPQMAPLAQYQSAGAADEIALARSAAPEAVSGNAEILILGKSGYEPAVRGNNGFVCIVERSWGKDFDDPEFWNPGVRAPICFNAAATRSVLAAYLEKTRWVLAGVSKADMLTRTQAELAANSVVMPEAGAMCFMMSKQGYLSDRDGHWHPHLMFYVAHMDGAAWGADLKGSPIYSAAGNPEPITTFFVPVARWSDGTDATMAMH